MKKREIFKTEGIINGCVRQFNKFKTSSTQQQSNNMTTRAAVPLTLLHSFITAPPPTLPPLPPPPLLTSIPSAPMALLLQPPDVDIYSAAFKPRPELSKTPLDNNVDMDMDDGENIHDVSLTGLEIVLPSKLEELDSYLVNQIPWIPETKSPIAFLSATRQTNTVEGVLSSLPILTAS